MSDELLENLKLPTELSRDVTGLQQIAADLRKQMADPSSPIYGGRPDLIAAAEKNLRALEIRAGAVATPETPEALARRQQEAFWAHQDNPAFTSLLDNRKAELMQLPETKLEEMASALARELGPSYFTLLEQAKVGLGFAEVISLATRADLGLLRVAAAKGQFALAKSKSKRA